MIVVPPLDQLEVHAWVDTTNRCPSDAALRKLGFRIYMRQRDTEPIWERDGKLYSQREAMNARASD